MPFQGIRKVDKGNASKRGKISYLVGGSVEHLDSKEQGGF